MKPFFLFLFLIHFNCYGQKTTSEVKIQHILTVNEQIADFDYLISLLAKLHPSLHRFTNAEKYNSLLAKSRQLLNRPMEEIVYWRILQTLVASLKSGHTNVELSDYFNHQYAQESHNLIPFLIYIKDEDVFIKYMSTRINDSIAPGNKVLRIDNDDIPTLLSRFRPLISCDGHTLSLTNYKLEGGEFNKLYNLLYNVKSSYKISYENNKGQPQKCTVYPSLMDFYYVQPESIQKRVHPIHEPHNFQVMDGKELLDSLCHHFTIKQDASSSAWLTIKSFMYQDYKDYHRNIFKIIKDRQIQNLVIDIRDNPGGEDYICIDLLRYLLPSDFYYTLRDESKVNLHSFFRVLNNVPIGQRLNLNLVDTSTRIIKLSANKMQKAYNSRFRGSVYLLTNGGTFSAASLFATALKKQRDVKIIGQETGGCEDGCDGGIVIKFLLPQTGLVLNMPLLWTKSVSESDIKDKGLLPDVLMPPSFGQTDLIQLMANFYITQQTKK